MLPSLTSISVRRRPDRRAILGIAGGALLSFALILSVCGNATSATPHVATTADALAPNTWAISVPTSWFVAPIAGLHAGDHVDVLALRPGERASATAIAFDLIVMSADDRTVTFGTGADDATALGVARASGLLLVPLLRSTR